MQCISQDQGLYQYHQAWVLRYQTSDIIFCPTPYKTLHRYSFAIHCYFIIHLSDFSYQVQIVHVWNICLLSWKIYDDMLRRPFWVVFYVYMCSVTKRIEWIVNELHVRPLFCTVCHGYTGREITSVNEMNFQLKHAPVARTISPPVDLQSNALPVCYGCPPV